MNKYFEYIQPNIDAYGVIANNNNDEGDSSQREGSFALCISALNKLGLVSDSDFAALSARYDSVLTKIKCGKGGLHRGPNENAWTGQNDVMSRDQWVPNAIACGMTKSNNLNYLFLGHLIRALLFTTNTCADEYWTGQPGGQWKVPDITVLSSWSIYIRSYNFWLFYPLMLIFDLETLVNSLIIVWQSYYNPTETDVSNQINKLIQAHFCLPTPITWLSAKILTYDKRGMQTCLDEYFSPSLNAPAMNNVYRDIIPKVIK